jgi:hypothetical protein
LDELAESQGVKPLSEINVLFGTWPGDDQDGFEDDILALRQSSNMRPGSYCPGWLPDGLKREDRE